MLLPNHVVNSSDGFGWSQSVCLLTKKIFERESNKEIYTFCFLILYDQIAGNNSSKLSVRAQS